MNSIPFRLLGVLLLWLVAALPCPTEAASGSILVDPEFPHSFRYSNGERFFPMGDTAYFLIGRPTNIIARYIDSRRKHGFNFIRAMAMAEGFWPFGGTLAKPDYSTLNESAMRKWDWVFDYAAARRMNIDLILWGYGLAGGEGLWARQQDQDFWITHLVRRFKDRENLFLFTIANEFERYPSGNYEYSAADVDWARKAASLIREIDKVHAIGCHPSVWITDSDGPGGTRPLGTYHGIMQQRPPVVWPLWEGSAVNVNVTQNNEGMQPRIWGNLPSGRRGLTYYPTNWDGVEFPAKWTESGWEFEAPGLQQSIAADWEHGKPVLNMEFGYQYEPGYESGFNYTTRQSHAPATVRKKAWRIALSGGYFAAGFEGTAVRHFLEADIENFRPQQSETLYRFFTEKTEYWKMAPHPELAARHNVLLARPGAEYIAYFPRGGTNYVQLESGVYRVQWLHAESGRHFEAAQVRSSGARSQFSPPEHPDDDWVLHLRSR